jgi:hypothetical protein
MIRNTKDNTTQSSSSWGFGGFDGSGYTNLGSTDAGDTGLDRSGLANSSLTPTGSSFTFSKPFSPTNTNITPDFTPPAPDAPVP